MAMRDPIRRFFLHLGKDVPHDPRWIVHRFGRAGDIDCNIRELRPREGVVEVVFEEVVFGKVSEVRGLNVRNVGGAEGPDIHSG